MKGEEESDEIQDFRFPLMNDDRKDKKYRLG